MGIGFLNAFMVAIRYESCFFDVDMNILTAG